MSTRFYSFAFGATLLLAAACSSSATPSDGDGGTSDAAITPGEDGAVAPSDASTTDAATATDAAPDATAACNDLKQAGSDITWTSTKAAAPTAAGGTIVDGTYVLTSFKIYADAFDEGTVLSQVGKATLSVRGNAASVVLDMAQGGGVARANETWTTTGVDLASSRTCASTPDGGALSLTTGGSKFTATATSITLLYAHPYGTIENVYTKQ